MTTRGMKEPEMRLIAALIDKVLNNIDKAEVKREVHQEVIKLCSRFIS